MSRTLPKTDSVDREKAIGLLRKEFIKRLDSDTSVCKLAAERGIFCKGFARFTDAELRGKYNWITRRRPGISREDLEEIANRWQLARQDVDQLPLACDVQRIEHDTCRGWDDFSNEELSRFYLELTGANLVIA
jgi:hypothetical protein